VVIIQQAGDHPSSSLTTMRLLLWWSPLVLALVIPFSSCNSGKSTEAVGFGHDAEEKFPSAHAYYQHA